MGGKYVLKWNYEGTDLRTREQLQNAGLRTRRIPLRKWDCTGLQVWQKTSNGGGYWRTMKHYYVKHGQDTI